MQFCFSDLVPKSFSSPLLRSVLCSMLLYLFNTLISAHMLHSCFSCYTLLILGRSRKRINSTISLLFLTSVGYEMRCDNLSLKKKINKKTKNKKPKTFQFEIVSQANISLIDCNTWSFASWILIREYLCNHNYNHWFGTRDFILPSHCKLEMLTNCLSAVLLLSPKYITAPSSWHDLWRCQTISPSPE